MMCLNISLMDLTKINQLAPSFGVLVDSSEKANITPLNQAAAAFGRRLEAHGRHFSPDSIGFDSVLEELKVIANALGLHGEEGVNSLLEVWAMPPHQIEHDGEDSLRYSRFLVVDAKHPAYLDTCPQEKVRGFFLLVSTTSGDSAPDVIGAELTEMFPYYVVQEFETRPDGGAERSPSYVYEMSFADFPIETDTVPRPNNNVAMHHELAEELEKAITTLDAGGLQAT